MCHQSQNFGGNQKCPDKCENERKGGWRQKEAPHHPGEGDSSPGISKLAPSRGSAGAATLRLPGGRHDFTLPSRTTAPRAGCPMLRVRPGSSRYHSNSSPALALSDRQRVLTHPARGRPGASWPRALIGRGQSRADAPPHRAAEAPPPAVSMEASCPQLGQARCYAGWLTNSGGLASGHGGHLESWYPPPRCPPGPQGNKVECPPQKWPHRWQWFRSHMGTLYLGELRSL